MLLLSQGLSTICKLRPEHGNKTANEELVNDYDNEQEGATTSKLIMMIMMMMRMMMALTMTTMETVQRPPQSKVFTFQLESSDSAQCHVKRKWQCLDF